MVNLDRENMVKDVKKRVDALSEYEQSAVKAIMEGWWYNIDVALDIVERGEYEFYPGITTLTNLVHKLVHERLDIDPDKQAAVEDLYLDLFDRGYRGTDLGVIRISA